MKLGSLFDGSGGFPLAGVLNGITPVWASEIEPYPIAVTSARLPSMKHLGSITEINGGNIESVDVITFGSPCQDLSIAGNQKGIENGARSSLFFQAIRIIKEMREATHGEYPRFAVWENVPGAFSSNKGNDFRLVLEALESVSEPEVSIHLPEKGKWQRAGEIVGDGWSIAWRTLDAQFWGVPQRRKRIYLVADFGSECAGEILFEREGVSRNFAPGFPAGETAAGHPANRAGTAVAFEPGAASRLGGHCWTERAGTLRADAGDNQPAVCYSPIESCGFGETGIGYWQAGIQCLRAEGENRPSRPSNVLVYLQAARTLEARHDSSPCIDRGQNVVCYALQGNGIDRADTAGCDGCGRREDQSYTLNTIDRPAVAYSVDCRNLCLNEELSGTLQAKENGGQSLNYQAPVMYSRQRSDELVENNVASCQSARQYKDATDLVVANARPPRKYIVRRLTPTECARLQGFPDTWGDVLVKGKPHSDSAEYKMWGNGIALPCAVFVLGRIAGQIERSEPNG